MSPATDDGMRYVRLKPYNPKHGYLVKRYSVGGQLFVFDESKQRSAWYRVDKKTADYLATKLQVDGDPGSQLLFDVATQDEQAEIALEEERRRLVELGIAAATIDAPVEAQSQVIDRAGGRGGAVPEEELTPRQLMAEEVEALAATKAPAAAETAPAIAAEEVGTSPAPEPEADATPAPEPKKAATRGSGRRRGRG